MGKPLKMTELTQAVKDAETIAATAIPIGPHALLNTPQDHALLERRNIAFRMVLAELLDCEYTRDTGG
jgi:hypothetical protein